MRVPDAMIWAAIGLLIGIVVGLAGGSIGGNVAESSIAKACNDRMYFIADDGMYLCKRHEPFK